MAETAVPGAPRGANAATRLAARIELTKLAHELDLGLDEVAFLADADPDELRRFRTDVAEQLFARHADRFARIAHLSSLVPVAIAARAAQHAVGPLVSARIAGSLPPAEAVRLAQRLPAEFLAEVCLTLDPDRVRGIVADLDVALVTQIGRLLLERGEHVVLGRFVSVVPTESALAVVDGADPGDLLRAALFADDRTVLPALVDGLGDDVLVAVVEHAHATDAHLDALTLVTSLDPAERVRVVALVAGLPPDRAAGFLAAVAEIDAWRELLPALAHLDDRALAALVNVPATADPAVLDAVLHTAHALDLAAPLRRVLHALDDEHLAALRGAPGLADPAVRAWLEQHDDGTDRLADLLQGP
ncbi:hypothetical protein [Nocardioides zeae]|uniref:Uncharacterized protein n=1 Tax=Nocardioides zeae TaxID=1457234 RepID=A0A6P0HHQ7_9ACTN|nr:hypothetical protein [Nocardioides zeae]NEN78279.1 hypothetical protein [Nocardioides zeae]